MLRRSHPSPRTGPRSAPAIAGLLVALALAFALPACIGAVDRADFNEELRARGGGLTASFVLRGIDAVEDELGSDALQFTRISIDGDEPTALFYVRNPRAPHELDTWLWNGTSLAEPSPVQLSASTDLDEQSFTAAEVPALERLDVVIATTMRALELEEGWVTEIEVATGEHGVRVSVDAESARARGEARFLPGGELEHAERT